PPSRSGPPHPAGRTRCRPRRLLSRTRSSRDPSPRPRSRAPRSPGPLRLRSSRGRPRPPRPRRRTPPRPPPSSRTAPRRPPRPHPAVSGRPATPGDRLTRLSERLSRPRSIGRGIRNLLTRGSIDEDTWDEIEETLLLADLGPDATDELMDNLRRRIQVLGTDDVAAVREVLREELLALVDPELDRRVAASRRTASDGTEVPSVLLMVGVNGTGKTTTVGKLARVLVAAERTVVLGAADTFRAAAADQLATWGARVGV